ncbi:MAG: isocitrate lyase/phosphoenolpyruvate mutase family protein [Flavobacteriales bacterium]
MNYTQKRELLVNLIRTGSLVRVVGAHDAITAQLIEEAAFDAVWAGSLGISTALGYPDLDVISMNEFLTVACLLNRTCNLPIIADCNSGYGSLNNLIRMVREYEQCGISAICIEDQVFPKKNSLYSSDHDLEQQNAFCEKLKLAVETRKDSNFLIIARIEALIAGFGVNEAIKRAHAYKLAGADVIAIHSKSKNSDEIEHFLEIWASEAPVMIIPSTYYFSDNLIQAHNVSMVVYANQVIRSIIPSIKLLLSQLSENPNEIKIPTHNIADLEQIFKYHQLSSWKVFESD